MTLSNLRHHLHRKLVGIRGFVGVIEDWCHLVLAWSNLIMLGLRSYT